jgi:tight adherence protein B
MLFGLILILSFGIIVLVLRPTKAEKTVQQRLTSIEGLSSLSEEEATDILKQVTLSQVPWLNDILQQVPGCSKLQRFILQADSRWSVAALLSASALITLGGAWLASFRAPTQGLSLLLGVAAGSSPYAYLAWKRAARLRRFEASLPEAIDLMARALRAGHAITSAIEMVAQEIPAPVSSEFRLVFEEQNFGLPLREAMLNLARRVPLADVQFLVTAVLVQKETGGNLAEVLDKTTAVIRERNRLKGQLRIYTAQGRVTGVILCALPFLLFALLDFLNPGYEGVLLRDPLGIQLVYAGLVMMVLGVLVIRKIVDIKV